MLPCKGLVSFQSHRESGKRTADDMASTGKTYGQIAASTGMSEQHVIDSMYSRL